MRNSSLCRALVNAWELAVDIPVLRAWCPEPDETGESDSAGLALYALPVLGALFGLAAIVLAKLLWVLIPPTGAAIVFALLLLWFSERRTTSRGLALAVSVSEGVLLGDGYPAALASRQSQIRKLTGPYANLLVMGVLILKFFAYFQCFRTGHPGFAGAAWILALSAEAVMARRPEAIGMPQYLPDTQLSLLLATAGFLMMFNLVALPMSTLIATGGAIVLTGLFTGERLRRTGQLDAGDMTLAGYGVEIWALTVALLLTA